MKRSKLLCSDLDGTMFPLYGNADERCLGRLKTLLRKKPNVLLCYVTGRSLKLAIAAIHEQSIPMPDYIITDVGTSIYENKRGKWALEENWRKTLASMWSTRTAGKILNEVREIKGIRPQPASKQTEFKASFYVSPRLKTPALRELHEKLAKLKVNYTLTLSKGREKSLLLDLLPKGASKERAIKTLRQKLGVRFVDVVFCGDSENDFSVLTSNFKTIVVNNADETVKEKVRKKAKKKGSGPTLYFSEGKFDCCQGRNVCGVLEGAIHHGIFSRTKDRGFTVQIHSLHGLVNGKYTDLGRDEDTGGQVVYVVELAKALSKIPGIAHVDLVTRRIQDKKYPNYAKKVEYLTPKARIVRIEFGGRKYLKKTKLWPYLGEYVSNVLEYSENEGMMPDVVHANYADAGLAGSEIAAKTEAVLVFTGHSLGIPKMKKLGVNKKNFAKFDKEYNFSKRLKAEQKAIDKADAVIVSTADELENQYAGYRIDKTKFTVINPGIDLHKFHPIRKNELPHSEITRVVAKGLSNPRKPMILAISRLDKRKNIPMLVKAFCGSKSLAKKANLIILTGIKKNPDKNQKAIYEKMRKITSKARMQKSVAFVKFVDFKEGIGGLYRLAAKSKGIFINPALIEPFGLTILEASASGLPVVATQYGGPREIISHGLNGMLVNPRSPREIAKTLEKILSDKQLWLRLSKNAVKNAAKYAWSETARKEAKLFRNLLQDKAHANLAHAIRKTFK